MKVIIFLLVLGLVPLAYADTGIKVKYYDQTAFKQHEFTLHLESCDESYKACHYKDRIQYVPIQIDMYKVEGDTKELTYIESIQDTTNKIGIAAIGVFMDHKYEVSTQYAAVVTSNEWNDTKVVKFWLHQKGW